MKEEKQDYWKLPIPLSKIKIFLDLLNNYKSLCTEFYDTDKPIAPEDALSYYLNEAKCSMQPVLEPMCGSGRFLIPILEAGINIEGTDASAEMLESCRNKCRDKKQNPVLFYQKIQEQMLPRKYGMAFIPSGSFGLITNTDDVKESLKRIHDCLLPEGKLFIETETPYSPVQDEIINVREAVRNSNSRIILTTKTRYNLKENIETIDCKYENFYNDVPVSSESETIEVRHYTVNEFQDLLKSAGFSEISAEMPYTGHTATEKNEMVLFKGRV